MAIGYLIITRIKNLSSVKLRHTKSKLNASQSEILKFAYSNYR